MSKKVEKEPLLFVDTGYLGCYVSEQSYFKTPTTKPADISNGDYVHNYANADFFDFDKFHISNERPTEEASSEVQSIDVLDEEYERVDIYVDEEDSDEEDIIMDEVEEVFDLQSEDEFDSLDNIKIEEIEVDGETLDEEELDDIQEMDELGVIDEGENEGDVIESNLNKDSGEEDSLPVDEKQRELLLFIQDLTNRPSQMKAPIVQVVQKDGTLKSGILTLSHQDTVMIDNLMDEVEEISIGSIEGIRILHM